MDYDITITEEMDKFLDEVDAICFKYCFEILPYDEKCMIVTDGNESIKIVHIDGDGRGK